MFMHSRLKPEACRCGCISISGSTSADLCFLYGRAVVWLYYVDFELQFWYRHPSRAELQRKASQMHMHRTSESGFSLTRPLFHRPRIRMTLAGVFPTGSPAARGCRTTLGTISSHFRVISMSFLSHGSGRLAADRRSRCRKCILEIRIMNLQFTPCLCVDFIFLQMDVHWVAIIVH